MAVAGVVAVIMWAWWPWPVVDIETLGWGAVFAVPSPVDDAVAVYALPATGTRIAQSDVLLVDNDVLRLGPPEKSADSIGWMPDGQAVIYSYSELGSVGDETFVLVDRSGQVLHSVPVDTDWTGDFDALAVNPMGTQVVWAAHPPRLGATTLDLWSTELETGTTTRILDTRDVNETWPKFIDDNLLLFKWSERDPFAGDVVIGVASLDLDSKTVQRLTPSDQTVVSYDVDPTGRWLVYTAYPGNRRHERSIWYLDTQSDMTPVLLSEEPALRVSVSSDGRRLLVYHAGSYPGRPSQLTWIHTPPTAPWLQ